MCELPIITQVGCLEVMVAKAKARISWGEASLFACHSKVRGKQVSLGPVHLQRGL